jgi:hypothetical protein
MWALVRDVVFAGFGLWLIYRETISPGRDALALLGVAVALTVPSAAEHIKAILPSSAGESAVESSSRPSPRHGPPPSSTAPGVPGERGA